MPLQATSGAASYDAFGGGVPVVPQYIEDVFSTWLRISDGTNTQTVVNGINLSVNGGLVWSKPRAVAGENHIWVDSARGVNKYLSSDLTGAQGTMTYPYTFNTNGYTVGNGNFWANGVSLVDWTFRKQPKFFDVVTWTGDDAANRQISHSLGSVPGCIIVKRTDASATWRVWHQNMVSNPANLYQYQLNLNTTNAVSLTYGEVWGTSNNVTSTTFQVGSLAAVNGSGGTYVAYVFAHNAGGFGLTGTDNVISCGSYTGTGSPVNVNLGYEAQWVLIKRTDSTGNWYLMDTMRGMSMTNALWLYPNASDAEVDAGAQCNPTATGFTISSTGSGINAGGGSYIYIAIRRGPMKVPTSGTSVFAPVYATASSGTSRTIGFTADLTFSSIPSFSDLRQMNDRLRGYSNSGSSSTVPTLLTSSTAAEAGSTATVYNVWNTTVLDGNYASSFANIWYHFGRAPSFFDEVCYTGDGTADGRTFTHNLGATPQLVIVKRRSSTSDWVVMFNTDHAVLLNSTNADTGYSTATGNYANGILVGTNATTLTQYSGASGNSACNASGSTYVAYLFATAAGVSKVGSYTGNGSTQTINCGFTGGARFVLIKRTDSTGDWWTYDSARGITSGNDPYLFLNSTAAEVTSTNYVDTDSTGFKVTAAAPAGLNASGGTFIFFAVA